MNNPYILPVCFTMAAHGALLFGFTRHPRPIQSLEIVIRTPFVIEQREEDVPVLTRSDPTEPAPKRAPEAPRPVQSPEPPAIEFDRSNSFVMERPPIQRFDGSDMRNIPDLDFTPRGENGTGRWSNSFAQPGELDSTPGARFQASPAYPFEAKRNGMPGEVHVDFMVDERGHVVDPRIVRSSNRLFEEPTLRAVSKWKFEPGRRHGKVVTFRMMVPVMFNLNEDP